MTVLLDILKAGGVALVETDTVYGLAALPGSAGYQEIFKIKQRDISQVLPWLIGNQGALDRLGDDVPAYAYSLANMFWPGALTLVVKASKIALSFGPVANDGTVALRMPDNKRCLELLGSLDSPLACTSANRHGYPAPSRLQDIDPVIFALPHDPYIASECPGKSSSTIVDCTGPMPKILRNGDIDQHVINTVAFLDATLS